MTKSGGSKHQKRIAAPGNWVIERKSHKFAFKANPGPHSGTECIPLGLLLRDVLKIAETTREVKLILHKNKVKVDNRVVTNPKFPVGLMDVIEIEGLKKAYQIRPHHLHIIMPYEITKLMTQKACQIKGKTTIKGGITQLNLHDGRNINLPLEEGIANKYMTKDTIIIDLPSQKIVSHYPFKEGMYAIITAGKNVSKHGAIKEIQWRFGPRASTVTLTSPSGEEVKTTPEYIFVVGEKEPFWGPETGADKK